MVSIKDFARDNGVSYEAVRKQIKRYEAELQGHIHQQGRTQYLDDVAVAFLSEHRARNPIVLYDTGADQRVLALEAERDELKSAVSDLKDQLIDAYKEMAGLRGAQARLEAAEKVQVALEASRDEYKARSEEKAREATEAAQREQEASRKVQALQTALEASESARRAIGAELEKELNRRKELREGSFFGKIKWVFGKEDV